MKRAAILIDKNIHGTTLIMVDVLNAKEIFPYIFQESLEDDFKDIRLMLKKNFRNSERYRKVNVSGKASDIYEMRFINTGRNDRIYCKEIRYKAKRFIVMVELFIGKKSQQIPKEIKFRIEKIGGYKYEI
jgi:hypothetical protein